MFNNLTDRLSGTIRKLRGKGRLTEETIREAMREVRIALLEADVALPVVQSFISQVRERALGQEVMKSLTPGQALVKVVHEELVHVMGDENAALDLNAAKPVVVLVAGLQGSGKTTTTGKLARHLINDLSKKVMVVSCDVYRPAAIEQLRTLAEQVGAIFSPSTSDQDPVEIARAAVDQARRQFVDVLLVDTAGRLHIDEQMMLEISAIHSATDPHETLFVVDSMTGQDAANTARAFNETLPLSGVVLTKTDGDARGGAALSVRHITGKPIKFIGSVKKPMHCSHFILKGLPRGYWEWETCFPWSRKFSVPSTRRKRKNWRARSRKAKASAWRTSAVNCSKCRAWAASAA